MQDLIYWSLLASAFGAPPPTLAQVAFFEGERFDGPVLVITQRARSAQPSGLERRMSSAVVLDARWEVCEAPAQGGRCTVLRQGRYASPAAMGLTHGVASARLVPLEERVDTHRLAPAPVPIYDARRRWHERLYRVPVASVRAVVGTPDRRCWASRESVLLPPRRGPVAPGAVVGGLMGGILGHRAEGLGPHSESGAERAMERCSPTSLRPAPDHWEATYSFRGQDHVIQTVVPPGMTLTVNRHGEPRT